MTIFLKKFGTLLNSRMSGKEALAAFQPSLKGVRNDEKVEVDFEGVDVFTPSWGDEFLSPLFERFGDRLTLKNTENLSVQASLKMLEKVHSKNFSYA
ncbi:STAS-like domain-containing protein [Candidatus Parcubacteria bacterium]|nr:STAS-like domain-containing protein [Patescibacteria group bacterium]MBU4482387.1 STAS-like domain-containing protein [Patescibacteria group bacterium]MCG2687172.1 STAS-like domain-containing protein [Candidatus Parcubacteria bacterium]